MRKLLLLGIVSLAASTLTMKSVSAAESGTLPPPAAADLTIAKTRNGTFSTGQIGTPYTITASSVAGPSAGPTTGTVTVMDTLPAGLTATSMFGLGWSCDVGMLTCTRSDTLNPGIAYPSITLIVDVATDASCLVTNTATVSGGGDISPGNDSASDPTPVVDGQPPAVTPPGSITTRQTLCQ